MSNTGTSKKHAILNVINQSPTKYIHLQERTKTQSVKASPELFTVRLIHPGLENLMWGPTIPISKRGHFTGFGLVAISNISNS